ncbi:hypothetical protein PHYBLDRAFT_61382 [Phycomyces blakesleeanus NRRL 1555(-)]|uniref:Uncharacterized protein n=1 Tax=Phycomyces blakesleeanus (strain ATCC 8743b / DSM 1359 / FGSC 10004 / NBRC 33097 / NRRL 1555) TaxID=763407 RepID=A0A162V6D9_PHYB8|nr:hypothetical protein PHYBLDRAFT_61382 [Phycomyces blakesleeanus NRRL 1555(-)]OAD80332.1 hypothetical protein PHYBLDRAFT_61382 [Phycomyces blakesleeanus NRRL 1555(-)]|eukprot:XP_018298372.1 hypothetical protein PHYBLDRAFT_61382 [Phycomyces blakesleeanus NRRL 1555(-)]
MFIMPKIQNGYTNGSRIRLPYLIITEVNLRKFAAFYKQYTDVSFFGDVIRGKNQGKISLCGMQSAYGQIFIALYDNCDGFHDISRSYTREYYACARSRRLRQICRRRHIWEEVYIVCGHQMGVTDVLYQQLKNRQELGSVLMETVDLLTPCPFTLSKNQSHFYYHHYLR